MEHLISNKEFMNNFIATANKSLKQTESYTDVYYKYENQISDDDILALLDYCEDNDLLDY